MLENQIGKRYAEALSGNIGEDSQLGEALLGLKEFGKAMKTENELLRFFEHPSIPKEKKKHVVEGLCSGLQIGDKVANLLMMLNERGKILYLDKIIEYFQQVVDRRLGQQRIHVTSAHILSDENTNRLKTALNKILGKTILIDIEVDESLIGGVMLRIGDQVADDTIRNRLDILKRTIEKEEVA